MTVDLRCLLESAQYVFLSLFLVFGFCFFKKKKFSRKWGNENARGEQEEDQEMSMEETKTNLSFNCFRVYNVNSRNIGLSLYF